MPEKKVLVAQISDLFDKDELPVEQLRAVLVETNPIDIAEILGSFDEEQKLAIFNALDEDARALVIDETDDASREQLVESSEPGRIGELINTMPPDEATDLLDSIPDEMRAEVLEKVDDEHAREVIELDRYPTESAGGIMTTRFLSAGTNAKVGQVLEMVRNEEKEFEAPNFVFVLDKSGKLHGVAKVSELLSCGESIDIISMVDAEPITVKVTADQEKVSTLAARYNLQVVPVVDEIDRMVGIVTHDDVVDVIEQEAVEDLYKLAGESYQPLNEPVARRVFKRLPWLTITLGGGMLLSFVLKRMDQKGPMVFLPVIMAMAGNVGIQSSAMLVRGIATGEVEEISKLRLFLRELLSGITIGVICGVLIALVAHGLQGGEFPGIGIAAGFGMFVGITAAACLGTLVPLLCNIVSVDPAIAAGPFITTMNDVVCAVIYMNIAQVLIKAQM